MPAPAALKKKFVAQFEAMIDGVWDEAAKQTLAHAAVKVRQFFDPSGLAAAAVNTFETTEPVRDSLPGQQIIDWSGEMSPQKRGAQNRAPKGLIKGTIKDLIYNAGPEGITAAQIRDVAKIHKGVTIKDGSMKQGLRLLQRANAIERKGTLYFPTKNGGQSSD
jgi:hypothetical protein